MGAYQRQEVIRREKYPGYGCSYFRFIILLAYLALSPSAQIYCCKSCERTSTTATHSYPIINKRPGRSFANKVTQVKFTRQFLLSTNTDTETSLRIFVHASVKSYGGTAYITDQSQAKLVMAKNRVAPVKQLTPPNTYFTSTRDHTCQERNILVGYPNCTPLAFNNKTLKTYHDESC